uniref:Uncharacterized protein n=1 Tax=Candidatus Nitrotoga fabula TaxID=2182327 RepID=A0A2X0QVE9_9PROT|nr:membrane protein of unknown function [Candidatus Nitrotoga fabula]
MLKLSRTILIFFGVSSFCSFCNLLVLAALVTVVADFAAGILVSVRVAAFLGAAALTGAAADGVLVPAAFFGAVATAVALVAGRVLAGVFWLTDSRLAAVFVLAADLLVAVVFFAGTATRFVLLAVALVLAGDWDLMVLFALVVMFCSKNKRVQK